MRNTFHLVLLVCVVIHLTSPASVVAQIEATMEDEIQVDQDNDTRADPGDTLRYTITITHPGAPTDPDATNLQVTVPLDANTTLVPGGVRSTPVGIADRFETLVNGRVTITVSDASTEGVLANDVNLDGDPLTVVDAGTPQTTTLGGTVVFTANGGFTYTPPQNATGVDTFTYTVTDPDGTDPTPTTVTIGLNVNVAPSFVAGPNQSVREDSGPHTVPAWATALSTGPPHEAGQRLRAFLMSTTNDALFTVLPAISVVTGDLTYTPAPDANGTVTVTVRLRDNGGTAGGGMDTSAPQTFTITITAVNDAPVATADAYSVPVRGTVTVPSATGVLANDTDADADPLTAVLVTAPTHGTLTLGPGGAFTYIHHDGNSAPSDQFTYQAHDGVTTSAPAVVTLIIGANTPPFAVDDTYRVAAGGTLTVSRARGVLANDTDAEGTALTALLVAGPTSGTLGLSANGSFTYTHNGSSTRSDSFTYQASDGLAQSPVATVTITITPVNTPPVARDDGYSVAAGGTLTVGRAHGVLANDTDADSDPLTALLLTGPAHGTLTLRANGAFTYTHDGSGALSDQFTYQARDGSVTSAPATVIFTIGTNTAPVAVDDAYNVAEGGTLTVDRVSGVLANDTDAEGDPLSALLVAAPTSGTLTLHADGRFTYTHDGSNTISDRFTYQARDGLAQSRVAAVTLTITPVNTPPVVHNDAYSVAEGGTLTVGRILGVLANDTDAEDDPLTAVLVAGPTSGTLTLHADGRFTYTHDGSETPSDRWTYQARDGISGSAVATVTVTITPFNDAPVANNDAYSVAAGNTLTVDRAGGVLANDTDAERDPLTALLITGPRHGTLTLRANGAFTYTHDGSSAPSDQFTYQARDGGATSVVAAVTLTVGANTAPRAVDDAYSVAEGSTVTIDRAGGVLANDSDAEGDPLTTLLVDSPTSGTLTLNADGSFTYTHNGSQTPSDRFTYQANDGAANSLVATVTLTITFGNDAPVAVADTYGLQEGDVLTSSAALGVLANDTDPDGDPLRAVLVSGPLQGILTLHVDGSFTYTHNGSETTLDQFTYQASDGTTSSLVATVTLRIIPVNDAPRAIDDTYSVNAGDTLTVGGATGVLINDFDAEGEALTAMLVTLPMYGTLTLDADGGFTYVHDGSSARSDSFTYQADDGTLDSAAATVTLTLLPGGGVPIAANDAYSVDEGATLTVNAATGVLANDSDPQGDTLSAVLVTLPTHGTLALQADGSFTYTHDGSETTSDRFTYQASDGVDNSPVATVMFTITPSNDAPIAVADAYGVPPGVTLTVSAASGVLSNDRDADGDPLTVVLLTGPTHGTLTLSADGSFTYAHNGTNTSSDSFTYQAQDGVDSSAETTVALTIGTNTAPVAMADVYTVVEGSILTVNPATGVLSNDTDIDGNVLSAVLVNGPAQGILTLNSDGSFTYTHDGSETLSDRFTYQASDGMANSTIATVTLTITPVNDAPVAVADAYGVPRGGLLTVASATGVLANDTDAERAALTAVLVTGPTQGTLTLSADGSFTYTHNGSGAPGDGFTYRAGDGVDLSAETTVTITAIPANTAPVAVADAYVVDEGATLTVTPTNGVLRNDTDAEGDALTAVLVTSPAHGTLTLNVNGSFTYTHNGSETTSDRFTYQARDGSATSVVATVTLTVTAVNDAPVVTAATFLLPENSADGTVVGTVTFTDPDAGQSGTFSLTGGNTGGAFAINASTGQLTVASGVALDFESTPSFRLSVRVTDNGTPPLSDSASITVNLTNANDAPTDLTLSSTSVAENQASGTTVGRLAAIDPDAGDTHTFSLVAGTGSTDNAAFQIVGRQLQNAVVFDFETKNSYSIRARATDSGNLTVEKAFTISVTNVNEAPVITEGANVTVNMDEDATPTAFVLTLNATDVDGDTLRWSISSGAGKGTASASGTGFSTAIGYTPNTNVNGSDNFAVQVADGNGGTDTITVNVAIAAVNDAPAFTKGPNQTVLVNAGAQTVTNWATGISTGAGNEAAQTLTFTVTGNTNPALFAVAPAVSAAGTLTYTLAANTNGTTILTVVLQDNGGTVNGGSDTSVPQTFTLSANQPPAITSANTTTFTEGTAGSFTVTTTGFPDPTLSLTAGTLPNGVLFAANGPGTFQPEQLFTAGTGPQSVAIADINGDGNLDLVTANNSSDDVSVLRGNGNGTFQPQQTFAVGSLPFAVAIADVNGDGDLDLVTANQTSSDVSVLRGNGNGTFQPQQTFTVGSFPAPPHLPGPQRRGHRGRQR